MLPKKLIILFITVLAIQLQAATFRPDSIYSKWIIDSRMGDFRNKAATCRFLTPTTTRNVGWDYVSGLVAKGILKAWEQYKDMPWSAYYFTGIQDYADNVSMLLGASNLDDLNAGKMYFELYRGAIEKGQTSKAATYKANATTCRNTLKNTHTRIGGSLPGKGGFWHKLSYTNQMWLDGLYMGPSLYAEWQGSFGAELGEADNTASWNDIALQFDTIFKYTWDSQKKLCYHAWSAEPLNAASSYWANATTGRSQEFWARGMGWFFAALVDVIEYMPATHPARSRLIGYANQVADGLKARQDATSGCWYQLLQYDATKKGSPCNLYNYLESSASSMFTYAYYKGIRLGILDKSVYKPVADKAYLGLINTFVVEEGNGKIKLIQSCESAGLSSTRKGDASYYLCGSDVVINNNTEGKVLGPFIMASLEYETSLKLATASVDKIQSDFRVYSVDKSIKIQSVNNSLDSIVVFNISGQQISNTKISSGNTSFSVEVPHSGLYLVQVNLSNTLLCRVD